MIANDFVLVAQTEVYLFITTILLEEAPLAGINHPGHPGSQLPSHPGSQ